MIDETVPTPAENDEAVLKLTATHVNCGGMPASDFNAYKMLMTMTSGIDSAAALKRRLHATVHIHTIDGNAVRVKTLNQRFGRLAFQHGTTIVELMAHLIKARQVMPIEGAASSAFVSTAIDDERMAVEKGMKDIDPGYRNPAYNLI